MGLPQWTFVGEVKGKQIFSASVFCGIHARWKGLLNGGDDETMGFWDVSSLKSTLKGHKQALEAADLSATGQLPATSSDGCVTNSCKPGVDF